MSLVSVIFVCEQAEQLTGSGCCGKLGGDSEELCKTDLFQDAKQQQALFGILHRAVKEFFPPAEDGTETVTLVRVDPRNQLYLIPKLIYDVFAYRPGWWAGLKSCCQLFSLPAVLVNGKVITQRGKTLDPDTLCHEIRKLLETATANSKTKVTSH